MDFYGGATTAMWDYLWSVDRAGAPSSSTNAAMIEPLGIKTERDKMTASLGSGAGSSAGPSSHDRRDDERPHSKDSSLPKPLSTHHMLNNSSAAAPAPGGSSSSSRDEAPRGFQPYRPGEDLRHTLPPHFPLDAATAAAAYSAAAAYPAAFMPPHFTHPAFRFDDPLLLERYRMMQSPLMSGIPGYPPSMLPPPGISPLLHPGSRYPPELLAQHYPLMSPKLPDHRSPGASVERKSEDEERREREGRERHEREREERERERERREREEQERRERERIEKERQEREIIERERQERERQERERMERERMERERERQLSLERLRVHDAERKSPARNEESGRYGGSITAGTPRDAIYSDKYRNAMYPSRDSVLSKPYASLSAGVEERLTQSHLADKERGRQFMHEQVRHLYTEQYLRQQEALMREREQEKREQERRQGTPPSKDENRHVRTSESSNFHRPFADRPLTNGYEHNHFSDYERRIMTENILAQDRQILQDQQKPRSRPNSGHNGTNHSDSRTCDQVNDRSYLDKQHEGMQARLIESEKSRDHHAHLFNQRLNQYDYDRPHAETQPVVAFAYSHQNMYSSHNNKDSSHVAHNDSRELRVPDPSNYFRFDAPMLSKLDLEEKKMKEARMNGMYNSDDSASESEDELLKEEKKKEKLLVISRGPPCKLDKSPKKLKYMQQFGLTTKQQRKELDFERFTKRRKLYKESSVSPVQVGDENEVDGFKTEESLSPQINSLHSSIYHPDQLNREPDYTYKCRFLYSLGLQRVTPERRREMDIIRQVCVEDRKRRLGIKYQSEQNQLTPKSHQPNHILHDQLTSMKRKYREMESGNLRPHRPKPQRITLGQLHERHLQTEHSSRPSLSQSSHHPHQHLAPLHSSDDSRAVIYPESHDAKLRSREFAQEFHNEVLQATVKKEISKNQLGSGRSGSQSELRYNMDSLDPGMYRGQAASGSTTHSNNVIHSSKTVLAHDDSYSHTHTAAHTQCKWPGIEAILESYQKHCEEQKMEQGILIEQCQRLQRTKTELHKTAESLSRRMAELMQGKSRSEDERLRTQTAIDNLKKSLKVLR